MQLLYFRNTESRFSHTFHLASDLLLVPAVVDEMFNEEERGEKAQAEFEKECRENPGKQVMYIDTSTNNARVMKTCMKETRDAINFIRNPENDIEDWQLAGILVFPTLDDL